MQTATHFREIRLPTTKREGLENFLQMVINALESGDAREALLRAVDLKHALERGLYDDAMQDALGYDAMAKALGARHQQEIIKASEEGFARGVDVEKRRMSEALGLITRATTPWPSESR